MSPLFAGSVSARILTLEAVAWRLPAWLVLGMKALLPAVLIGLSLFMFALIPMLYISGCAQSLPEAQVPRGAVFLQKPFRLAYLLEQLTLVPRKV